MVHHPKESMRILYDGGAYQEHRRGGIKRYFANLISRLPDDFEPELTSCRPPDVSEPSHPKLRIHRFRRFRPQRISLRFEALFFGRFRDARHFDLAHPTYYTLLSQSEISDYRCPVVVTVWDMIHELFPDLDPSGTVIARKKRAIERADAILCISENTKRDLLAHYKVDESRVLVTYLASDLDPGTQLENESIQPEAYFLYVGERAGYKNFDGLLSAFATVATTLPKVSLFTVGEPFSSDEERRIAELGLSSRVRNYTGVSDTELSRLYRQSIAFVYPSLYEGFGIPPLEAMQCGTPVVASNRSSIPEVVGDAGILFDPGHADELVEILIALATQPEMRAPLIARGSHRINQFNWDHTAQQTLRVYRQLAR
ncbi:MAG TPA: glycosyltransferase family 1 protein [Pyrinomonadaceae bacterium]|jgi:glycosyltransferase involved in cell wall biosynthesis